MKRNFYILTLISALLSCSNGTEKTVDMKSADTLQAISTGKNQGGIYIKDKSKYSKTFLDELTNAGYKDSIKLIDNNLIIGNDTITFPDDLTINKSTVFEAEKGNKNYKLTLTRVSVTTLNFDFERTDKSKNLLDSKTGQATLSAMFFLASENDEDEEEGSSYGSYEYRQHDNGCWLSIRVGIGKDDSGKQRAKITFGCSNKSEENLNLEDCPTLRTE